MPGHIKLVKGAADPDPTGEHNWSTSSLTLHFHRISVAKHGYEEGRPEQAIRLEEVGLDQQPQGWRVQGGPPRGWRHHAGGSHCQMRCVSW